MKLESPQMHWPLVSKDFGGGGGRGKGEAFGVLVLSKVIS